MTAPETLEQITLLGGGLLEILFGGPLLRTFTGWQWDWNDVPSRGIVDELTSWGLSRFSRSENGTVPLPDAKRTDALSALAALCQEPQALSSVLDDVRSLLAISAAKSDKADVYLEVAKARIEGLSKGLSQGAVDALASRGFLSDLWWTQELFASVAVWRSRGSGGGVLLDDPPPNIPPLAFDDTYNAYHTYGQPAQLSEAAPGVLWNDIDMDGGPNPLSVVAANGSTAHCGWYSIETSGAFTYSSAPGYVGEDWFYYTLTDGADTDEGQVTISLGNHPPTVNASGYPDGPFWAVYMTELVVPAPGVRADDYDEDGDPFTVSVVDQPQHGSVTLHPDDGSFHYMPDPGFLGNDSFTYRAFDGYDYSGEATVSISVTRPEADIDTDSDNNGSIDMTLEEDQDEMLDPGKIVRWNWDDDNGNGIPDREDGYPFRNAQDQPVHDDDLVPARLDLRNSTGDLTGFTLELGTGPNTRLFASLGRQPLPMTYVIGTNAYPDHIYVEGYNLGQSAVTWTVKNPSGVVIHSDSIKFSVVYVNIWGYRPQTEGPEYGAPFDRIHVPSWQEETPGVGIRRNGDDDNGNGLRDFNAGDTGIQEENDLIEVELQWQPSSTPGVKFYLERSSQNINVWGARNKTDGRLVSGEPENAFEVTQWGSFWVEWATMDAQQTAASLELSAWDAVHNNKTNVVDTVSFYPFTSVAVAFGGNNRDPLTPENGTFIVAQRLYEAGYDVHAYNEEAVDDSGQPPYAEVVRAVERRGVNQVAIFGYSQGGGATEVLAQQLATNPPSGEYELRYTAYVDAVDHDGSNEENERPQGTAFHLNIYQENGIDELGGGPINGLQPQDEQINVTRDEGWDHSLDHYTIDNDEQVLARVRQRFEQHVDRWRQQP